MKRSRSLASGSPSNLPSSVPPQLANGRPGLLGNFWHPPTVLVFSICFLRHSKPHVLGDTTTCTCCYAVDLAAYVSAHFCTHSARRRCAFSFAVSRAGNPLRPFPHSSVPPAEPSRGRFCEESLRLWSSALILRMTRHSRLRWGSASRLGCIG